MDILTLLLRLKGREEILKFIEHHFFLVKAICVEDMQMNWEQIICDELTLWLNLARGFKKAYMSLYLMYTLANHLLWPNLPIILNYDEHTKVY